MTTPFTPPRFCDIEPCGGHIGPELRHFVVEEIPAYPLSGEGEHVFVWVEKEGRTTKDVAKSLARAADMKERDVGYAGMKDRHAVTRQWFSLCTKKSDAESWDLGEGAKVLTATRHGNKLRTGHLIGNRFKITLVDVPSDARERAETIAKKLREQGLPNYFGAQRFGREGRNLQQALDWTRAGEEAPEEPSGRRNRRRGKKSGRFDNKLLPSVIQSEVFNRYIAARLSDGRDLLLGEVVRLHGTGTSFVVADLEAELPRRQAGDLHLQGPMFGPKGLQATDDAKQLEEMIMNDLGLTETDIEFLAKHAPGTRRDLMIAIEEVDVSAPGEGQLEFSFALPAGGYATQMIREFTGCDWMNPRGERP